MTVLPPPQSGSPPTPALDADRDPSSAFAWLRFHQPAVRDLAFVLVSPPLMAAWPSELQPSSAVDLFSLEFWHHHYLRYLPRLLALDQDPAPLDQALAAVSSIRLGVRFETLMSFWLKDKSADWHDFVLLAQNIQLKDHKRTIGEIDFLIENTVNGEIEHWELALKFYLGEARLTPFDWRGLNDRDSFGRKIKHTLIHQFDIHAIDHPLLGQYPIDKRRAVFKGRLFYPDHRRYAEADLTATRNWLHPAHLRGTWGYDLPRTLHWRRAARREWLTPTPLHANGLALPYLSHGLYLGFDPSTPSDGMAPVERMVRVMPMRAPYLASFYTSRFTVMSD